MKQALHIFRKDTRRLWVEVLISVAALGLVTWIEWWSCTPARNPRWYNTVVPYAALIFSWWFLIERLIHGEALVGDRQFWITRPYVWYKLLAAKVLFVLLYVAVPIVISECVLLVADGAPVSPHLGPILLDAAGAMLIGVLPVAAVAVITRSLAQWVVGLIAVILIAIGLASLDSYIPDSHVPTGTDIADMWQAIAAGCLLVFGITIQFARRKKWLTFIPLAAAIVALPIIMAAVPYRSIIEKTFPLRDLGQVPFQISFVPKVSREDGGAESEAHDDKVSLDIPIEISNVPTDTIPRLDGVMLSFDTPDGHRWTSEWLPGYQELLELPKKLSFDFSVDRSVYEKLKLTPTPARLFLAFSQLEDQNPQRITIHQSFHRVFEVPGAGRCWISRDRYIVECRSVQGKPSLMLVTASPKETTCPSIGPRKTSEASTIIRSLNSNPGPGSGPLSPLTLRSFYLTKWDQSENSRWGVLCPGTPLTFSTPRLVRRFRIEFPLGQIRLQDYSVEPLKFSIQR